jgi:hypothetical protein
VAYDATMAGIHSQVGGCKKINHAVHDHPSWAWLPFINTANWYSKSSNDSKLSSRFYVARLGPNLDFKSFHSGLPEYFITQTHNYKTSMTLNAKR